MSTLKLTSEEIKLILAVSKTDTYADWDAISDDGSTIYRCPCCKATISDSDKISKHVTKEFYNTHLLPFIAKSDITAFPDDFKYENVYVYRIGNFSVIPFKHEVKCRIHELREIARKMREFAGV